MHFVKTLILAALPTIVDLGIDSFSAEKFIVGANYKRWVANLSDIQINNNCVRTSSNSDDGFLEITCFEQDTIWGRITAGLIFLLAQKENESRSYQNLGLHLTWVVSLFLMESFVDKK